jgi:phosphate transport system permease protein
MVNHQTYRKLKGKFFLFLCLLATIFGMFWLVFIIGNVIIKGGSAINFDLFFEDPSGAGNPGGGLKNAFVGQFLITIVSVIIGVPIGILGGIYLSEYSKESRYSRTVSILSDIMVSVPSIVIGTFAYAIFVKPAGKFNGWAGSMALAMIMIPVVLRTTEEMMKLVPTNLREAAYALGANRSQVTFQIVLRSASTGVLTGVILAIARVSGETAPLLFTSFNNMFYSTDMNEPMASLTVNIFQYAMGPYDSWHSQAWAASFIITVFILSITILSRLIIKRNHQV